jgi:drug/metabolite transporter (DMT)-like permease
MDMLFSGASDLVSYGPGVDARALAILLAVLAAVALAFGAQFQNDAVVEKGKQAPKKGAKLGRGSLSLKQLFALLSKPKWLSGTAFMAIGIVLQLAALSLAPLIVVQPVGAIALVITSLLNAKVTKTKLNRGTIIAVSLCTVGIAAFVAMASGVADETVLNDDRLREVLGVLGVILVIFTVLFFTLGRHAKALTYVIGAGVLYGFVATLAKVVIQRIYQSEFEWLTLLCLIALIGAVSLGSWFVQNAYSSGPPDLVIAGLTVIDPLVAVSIGIVILGEATSASLPVIIGFGFSAVVAVIGVILLSKVHPELSRPRAQTEGKI